MRNAPPVQYPVGLFLWAARVQWGLWLAAVLLSPVLLWGTPRWTGVMLMNLLLALITAWALHHYQGRVWVKTGQLHWGEEQWDYLEHGHAFAVRDLRVLWDAGDRIWLRWRVADSRARKKGRWLEAWLLERDAPEDWHLLRCAVAAHTGKNFTQASHST